MFVYLAGAIVCLVAVIHRLPDGGVGAAMAAASAAGKLALFDFSLDFRVPFTFWAGLVGGTFLTLATHGTDHYLVQRLLVARSQKDASAGLVLSGFLVMIAVRAVPVPGHAALGPLRGPAVRARRRGAADLRLDRARPAAGPGSSWPRWWRPRSRRRSTRWRPRPYATSTCRTSARTPRRRSRCASAARSPSSGASRRSWSRSRAQNMDSALQGGLAALSYASGPDRGRVPARRAHAPGDVDGDDDRHDRGAGHEPCRGNAGPVRLPHAGRGVDVERGRRRDRDVRGGNDPERASDRSCRQAAA